MSVYLHLFSRFNIGGAERQVSYLINHSEESHYILTLAKGRTAESFVNSSARILSLYDGLKLIFSRKVIIVSWFYSGLLLGLPLRLFGFQLYGTIRQERDSSHWLYYAARFASRFYTRIIYNSIAAKDSHCVDGWSFHEGIVVYNGYPSYPLANRVSNTCLRIVQYGRYTPLKGFELFRKVACENKHLRFACIGPGVTNVFKETKNCQVVKRLSLDRIMELSSVIVHLSETESFSNVWAEAIVCGKALVISKVGDYHVVKDFSGVFTVNNLNVEDVSQALEQAISWQNKQNRESLTLRREHFLSRFSVRQYVKNFESVVRCVE